MHIIFLIEMSTNDENGDSEDRANQSRAPTQENLTVTEDKASVLAFFLKVLAVLALVVWAFCSTFLVLSLAYVLPQCLKDYESFNPAKTNATLQPLLSQNETYGVVLTEVKGLRCKYLIAKTTDKAPMICIFLAEQVSIKNMSKSGTFKHGSEIINEVYANSHFNFSAYISGQDLSSVSITVQMIRISDRFWHEICKTNISHSNSPYTYKCLSNIGGYYKVLYTNQKKAVQITYTLNYDGIDITTNKNCTFKEKTTCKLPLNVEKKYKVIAVINPSQLYGSLNLTTRLESRYYYCYIAIEGSSGILGVITLFGLAVLLLHKCCGAHERRMSESSHLIGRNTIQR